MLVLQVTEWQVTAVPWRLGEEKGFLNSSVRADFSPGLGSLSGEISLFLPPVQEATSCGGFISCFSKKGEMEHPCTCCLLELKINGRAA